MTGFRGPRWAQATSRDYVVERCQQLLEAKAMTREPFWKNGEVNVPYTEREVALMAEIERLTLERDKWNADARRLSGGLMAIRDAAETVPAFVLRSIAYDIALNCIEPDVAKYQIERRAALEPQP